jgi:hypothetical protein
VAFADGVTVPTRTEVLDAPLPLDPVPVALTEGSGEVVQFGEGTKASFVNSKVILHQPPLRVRLLCTSKSRLVGTVNNDTATRKVSI